MYSMYRSPPASPGSECAILNILRCGTLRLHNGNGQIGDALPIKASLWTTRRGTQVVCEMAKSILGPIFEENLYRLHLWGAGSQASNGGGGVDDYIGRAAHVSTPFLLVVTVLVAVLCCNSKQAPSVAHGLLGYELLLLFTRPLDVKNDGKLATASSIGGAVRRKQPLCLAVFDILRELARKQKVQIHNKRLTVDVCAPTRSCFICCS